MLQEQDLRLAQEQMHNSRALAWLESVGIHAETVFRYGLGYISNDESGIVRGILFPAYSKGGELVSARVLHPKSSTKMMFYQIGERSFPFGLNHLRGNVPLVVCKNEIDALLVAQEAGDLVDVLAWWESRYTPLRGIENPQWFVVTDKSRSMQIYFWGDIPLCSLYFPNADIRAFVARGGNLRSFIWERCIGEDDPLVFNAVRELGGVCTTGFFACQRRALLSIRPEKKQGYIIMWNAIATAEMRANFRTGQGVKTTALQTKVPDRGEM